MACLVRDELDTTLAGDYGRLAEVVIDVRRTLRERGLSVNGDRWAHAIDEQVKQLVAAGQHQEARRQLEERLGG